MKKLVGIICREKVFSQISRECFELLAQCHCSATQSFTLSMSSTCLFTYCGLLVGCLIMALHFSFRKKKLKGKYALRESTSISQLDKDKSVAYMSSEESLSERAVSEWHKGNSSGSDEDPPNREKSLCKVTFLAEHGG